MGTLARPTITGGISLYRGETHMNSSKSLSHNLCGVAVSQSFGDGYVNVTQLSKAYFESTGKRRQPNDWLRLERTKETLEHLSSVTGIPVTALVRTVQGGNDLSAQGTYLHPRLSIRFGIWLSDEFGFAVEQFISQWSSEFGDFIQTRDKGKLIRRSTTDAIQNAGFTEHYHYINATQVVYRSLFGKTAKELKKDLGLSDRESLRDSMDAHDLRMVEMMEYRLEKELAKGVHKT
jgi:hypothetical protein